MLLEERKDLLGIKSVEVVYEDRSLAEPLTVELTPHRLRPTGIGNGEVKSLGIYLMPVLRGYEVTERILVVMRRDLGITRSTRSEVHEHRIAAAGSILRTCEVTAENAVLLVKVVPSLARAANEYLVSKSGALRR